MSCSEPNVNRRRFAEQPKTFESPRTGRSSYDISEKLRNVGRPSVLLML